MSGRTVKSAGLPVGAIINMYGFAIDVDSVDSLHEIILDERESYEEYRKTKNAEPVVNFRNKWFQPKYFKASKQLD